MTCLFKFCIFFFNYFLIRSIAKALNCAVNMFWTWVVCSFRNLNSSEVPLNNKKLDNPNFFSLKARYKVVKYSCTSFKNEVTIFLSI